MKEKRAAKGTVPGALSASGPSATPWLAILGRCLLVTGAATVLMAAAALIFAGWAGVGSVAFSAVVVMAFFGLSLLVGHFYGRRNPSGALGAFMVTYLVKVVGFAVILFSLGEPGWLDGRWFAFSGVAVVLLWQATELVTFGRQRLQLYNDPDDVAPPRGGGK